MIMSCLKTPSTQVGFITHRTYPRKRQTSGIDVHADVGTRWRTDNDMGIVTTPRHHKRRTTDRQVPAIKTLLVVDSNPQEEQRLSAILRGEFRLHNVEVQVAMRGEAARRPAQSEAPAYL
nr:unnamed protein product [Haemonchus contortus]